MPAVKIKRASSAVDMTAMTDVAFLLLTFFILTAQFKSQDAESINPPTSISQTKVSDKDLITIAIGREGKVYFGVDKPQDRAAMLDNVARIKGITFTDKERKEFSLMQNFGVPLNQLKAYLNLGKDVKGQFKQPGIPTDTTGAGPDNDLAMWVYQARLAGHARIGSQPRRNQDDPTDLRIAVKGDDISKFPAFKNVLATLQAQQINKFSLITGTEAPPAGWKDK